MNHFENFIAIIKDKVDILALMLYKEKLAKLSDEEIVKLVNIDFKSPLVGLLLGIIPALCFGGLSFDRLYKGDIKLGIVKILLWFWMLVNCFIAFLFLWDDSGSIREYIHLMISSLLLSVSILFIWNLIDFFLVWQGIKKDNLMKIIQFLEQNDENFIGNKQ